MLQSSRDIGCSSRSTKLQLGCLLLALLAVLASSCWLQLKQQQPHAVPI
jgi:hypothetical protein